MGETQNTAFLCGSLALVTEPHNRALLMLLLTNGKACNSHMENTGDFNKDCSSEVSNCHDVH